MKKETDDARCYQDVKNNKYINVYCCLRANARRSNVRHNVAQEKGRSQHLDCLNKEEIRKFTPTSRFHHRWLEHIIGETSEADSVKAVSDTQ